MSKFRFVCSVAAFLGSVTAACAASLESVRLEPVQHQLASLTIVASNGQEATLTQPDLEKLPTFRMTTTTPWRAEPASFEGVLLTDLLEKYGLSDATGIRVVAENDFVSEIPAAAWKAAPILVATRVDGKPHSRRVRGPIQFVVSADDYTNFEVFEESHLVWMAARIEASN